ncbi:hypothetical protein BB558_001653, partial [Smittium angustum]
MRVKTVQINWHERLPIFSIDFDKNHFYSEKTSTTDSEPTQKEENKSTNKKLDFSSVEAWRFATGGADGSVRIWKILNKPSENNSQIIEFRANLSRHTAPVNVVRFSPVDSKLATAGDDGTIIIWREFETQFLPQVNLNDTLFGDDLSLQGPELWKPISILRGSLADVYDIAWSPCGKYIISGSIDNTARIWDSSTAKCIQILTDHTHYVQGVAWDPLGNFVATLSCDRTMQIYKVNKSGNKGDPVMKNICQKNKLQVPYLKKTPTNSDSSETINVNDNQNNINSTQTLQAETELQGNKNDETKNDIIDENSSDVDIEDIKDELIYNNSEQVVQNTEPKKSKEQQYTVSTKEYKIFNDDNMNSFFRRLNFLPNGNLLFAPSGIYKHNITEKNSTQNELDWNLEVFPEKKVKISESVYAWSRKKLTGNPAICFPGFPKSTVVVKPCPVQFEYSIAEDDNRAPDEKLNDNADIQTNLQREKKCRRSIIAVASMNSTVLYDIGDSDFTTQS